MKLRVLSSSSHNTNVRSRGERKVVVLRMEETSRRMDVDNCNSSSPPMVVAALGVVMG